MEMGLDGADGDEGMEAQEWGYCKIISTAVQYYNELSRTTNTTTTQPRCYL